MHLNAAKKILRYVKGTLNYGLIYLKDSANNAITGFSDSDLAGNIEDRKRSDIGLVILYFDNRSAIDLAKNFVFHGRSKHIDIRYHFIRECVEHEEIVIKHVRTEEQRADVLTKAMSIVKFELMRKLPGVKNLNKKMSNDRSWINRRTNPTRYGWMKEYCEGVKYFLKFAERNCEQLNGEISCPCNTCKNRYFKSIADVEFDLFATGFLESYTVWYYHGEGRRSSNENMNIEHEDVFDQYEMLRDAFGEQDYTNPEDFGDQDHTPEEPNFEASRFYTNLHNLDAPIYPGNTKFTKLTFVMRLVHFKSQNNCSDTGFDELLSLIADVLPEEHTLPSKYRDIKKMVKKINLGYEKIHACENDYMLFYGDDKDNSCCRYCRISRYKDAKKGGSNTIPRKDIRNVRLGLATDGFPPYSNGTSGIYSVWPVVIFVYNLPPSMCMKDPYMFMTLLVPRPNDPGKNLNVYLRPLIDELIQLWQCGVETYDAYTKTNFILRAALLWTISDYPGLAMVSGWSTKGKLCCHVCMGEVKAKQLPHSRKSSFYGLHKGFLNKRPRRPTGFTVRRKFARIDFPLPGKLHSKERADGYGVSHNWTHVTSFFDLPYWDTLRLRHCIDVMHTEKNVFERQKMSFTR
ncbi:uncharacterized protein LOC141713995 [Apium graveolens]|uniref:uncharacterized protein LOC141713995 n=1 Tax=Apium graveolens TaxID=4045 RepID=UPI003D7AF016